jgi:polyisoprenoid-binding protein YceI
MSTTTTPSIFPSGTWVIDPAHSQVGFAVKHIGIASVRGELTDFDGALESGDDLSSSKAHGTVKTASVDARQPQRDADARSRADYGMKPNEALGSDNLVVSDKVKLTLYISAVKQSS